MPYRVNCPSCQTAYVLPEDALGKKLQCKKCRQPFTVGSPKAPAPASAAAAKPAQSSTPRPATTNHPPAKPPRPAVKTPPRREAVQVELAPAEQPAPHPKSPRLMIGILAGVVLLLGAVLAGTIAVGVYLLKSRSETPIAQAPPVNNEQKDQAAPPEGKGDPPPDTKAPPAPPVSNPNPSPGWSETDKPLPPDLDLVPGDGAVFLSLQVAQTWKNPALAPVRKQAETDRNLANTLLGLKMMGLNPEEIERTCAIFWGKQKTPYFVGLVRMLKPYNRPLILGLVGEGQIEEKIGTKGVISSPKSPFSLHFIDDRSFLYGRTAEVKKLLERPAGPTRKAEWNAILHSAAQHTFLMGVQREMFPEDPKTQTPPNLKFLNPLLDAHTAVATLDLDKEPRLSVRLMFGREEEVKQAEIAARTGLDFGAAVLHQFAEQFKGAPAPMTRLAAVMHDVEKAVKKATVQSKDRTLECQLKLESADWPEALAAGAMMFFVPASKSPTNKPPTAPVSPQQAEAAIKKLGGNVGHEKFDDKKPIIEVTFLAKKVSDDELALLRSLPTLKKLTLLESGITDKGVEHLAGLSNLEELSLVGNRLTDHGLEQLKGLKKLQTLEVSGNDISDAGLVHLQGLTELKNLSVLGSVKITDKGMAHLAEFKNLEKLKMGGTKLTGSGLVHLKELNKLRELDLSHNEINDKELVHLKDVKSLKKLDLSGNLRITDAGLGTLKGLSSLEELRLISTQITKKGIEELKKALPKTEIKS